MKKIIFFILAVVIAAILSGCSFHLLDDNLSAFKEEELKKEKAIAERIIYEKSFGKSLLNEARLIAYTIDKDRTMSISLIYKYGDSISVVPITRDLSLDLMDHDQYRELYSFQLITGFTQILEQGQLPSDGEVVGAIISWRSPEDSCSEAHSVCDIDGDGRWDFLSSTLGFFGYNDDIPDSDKGADGIGFVTDEKYQKITTYNEKEIPTIKELESQLE